MFDLPPQLSDDEIRYQQRLADCEEQARRERAMHDRQPEPGPILWHDDKPATLALLARNDRELARIND